MKTMLPLAAALMTAVLSFPAYAAPADKLADQLDRLCVAPSAVETGAGLVQHGAAVKAFAAATGSYQDCLYGELNKRRGHLSQSEQEVIAARLSHSAYDLTAAREQYAAAVRAERAMMATQVADRSL